MCFGPDIPDPPNPNQVANAQTGSNISTATANAWMGNADQIGPGSKVNYKQSGTKTVRTPVLNKNGAHVRGKNGKLRYTTNEVPTFEVVTKLTGDNKKVYNQSTAAKLNLARTANQQSAFLEDYLGEPFTPDTADVEGRLMDLGRQRLDPYFDDQADDLRTRLVNQGIGPGSEAYDREMRSFSEGRNDAYNSLLLSGRGQAMNEAYAERNQPINEITALLSGGQVSAPMMQAFNGGGVANTDVAGIINSNYNQRVAKEQAEGSFGQSLMGGLFGLGAAGIQAY